METPISKSQKRALEILGLATTSEYQIAATTLDNAGYRRDAIPVGGTWRSAAKLSDTELIAAITLSTDYDDSDNEARMRQ